MTFKELLESVDIEELKGYIQERVEDKDEFAEFVMMINSLLDRKIQKDESDSYNLVLAVIPQYDYFSDDEDEEQLYLNVYGVDDKKECFALDFTPWNKWLSFPVLRKSIDEYGVLSFIYNCLNEMSFISFSEDNIQEEANKLNELSESIKSGDVKTYTLEEVIDHLNESCPDELCFEIPKLSVEEKEKQDKCVKELIDKNKKLKEIFLEELNEA